ncbi:Carboxypeptidase B, partial [Gryllus bimaculatus]
LSLGGGVFRRKAPDYEDMMAMGRKAVDAVQKAGGQRYQVGAATKLLYPTSGGSDDWAKGVAGIKYAYTVELRDKGDYGFLLPATQIVPTGRETFAGIKALVRAIACKT